MELKKALNLGINNIAFSTDCQALQSSKIRKLIGGIYGDFQNEIEKLSRTITEHSKKQDFKTNIETVSLESVLKELNTFQNKFDCEYSSMKIINYLYENISPLALDRYLNPCKEMDDEIVSYGAVNKYERLVEGLNRKDFEEVVLGMGSIKEVESLVSFLKKEKNMIEKEVK